MATSIKQWLQAALDVIMPRTCSVCGAALDADEPWLCRQCMSELPRTHLHEVDSNVMEQLFFGKVRIERATGYFWYEKGSNYARILHDIKYHHAPRMAQWLAARAASEAPAFFHGIDLITPVPLHDSKLAQRGYNQSLYIARGISQVTGAPIIEAVTAVREHSTQTRKGAYERWQNIQGAYALDSRLASQIQGKHILLIDDVVTTGSTLEACAHALHSAGNVTVSLFTLAVARLS
ncbi:MAG: ComF family protein [Muribaculaceae bacterium]|nr:ComF family protein [Muribaculaceae bacterium]